MVHRNGGLAQRKSQRVGKACTGQKRAAQARALCKRHGIDIGIAFAGFLQGCFGERHQPADVVAAGQFGHHAAVFRVHRHLRVQLVRQQAVRVLVKRHAGFIA